MLCIGEGVWRVHNTILVVYGERKGVRCLPEERSEDDEERRPESRCEFHSFWWLLDHANTVHSRQSVSLQLGWRACTCCSVGGCSLSSSKPLYCRVIALLPRAQRSASLLSPTTKNTASLAWPFPSLSYPCLSVWLSLPRGSRHARPCSTGVGGGRGGQTLLTRPPSDACPRLP